MEYSRQKMNDQEFFGSGYKIETHSSVTAKKLANDFEIEQLMVSQKLKPIQRFKHILLNGSDLQKWSVFQNMTALITQQKQIKPMLESVLSFSKDQSKQLFGIMADGLIQLLQTSLEFSTEQLDNLTKFTFKILGYQQANIAEEWIKLLKQIFIKNPKIIKLVQQHVLDSFDFKASQHRRMIGILLIDEFYQYSQKFRQQTIKKLLLFTQDRNKICRQSICNVFGRYLNANPNTEEIWKTILDYSRDKESLDVRDKAANILTTIYRSSNFQSIISLFQNKQYSSTISPYLSNFLKIFSSEIGNQQTRSMFLNIVNGSLKGKGQGLSPNCIKNIIVLTQTYGLKFLNDLSDTLVRLSNNPDNFNKFILLFASLPEEERPLQFRNIFYVILKNSNYTFAQDVASEISSCLSIENENDLDVCIKLCVKSLEASLWNAEKIYIETLKKWKYTKLYFDRVVLFVTKHLAICPQFLNQPVFELIKHLLLMNKKRRDFMFGLKEKMANSKNWTHRRNFIQIYEYLYKNCSWQLMNQIIPLPMYIFVHEKVINIKLQQCKFIASVYQYINPAETIVKNSLKQNLIKYAEDKNSLLSQYANTCLKTVNKSQSTKVQEKFKRNNELYEQEALFEEIQQQPVVKQITTHKALLNSKQNLSVSKKPENKKISVTVKKDFSHMSTEFKKGVNIINNPPPISRKSAILKAPTLPIDLGKVPRKTDKK